MTESKATRIACEAMRSRAAWVVSLVGSVMQGSGLPDRRVSHRRVRAWVEFKRSSGKLTPMQRLTCRELLDRHEDVLVARFSADWSGAHIEHPLSGELLATVARISDGAGWIDALATAVCVLSMNRERGGTG